MFAGVKQGSNPSQVDVTQAHKCLSVDRCVEVGDDPLGLSLRVAVVIFHTGRNHRWKLSRLAVFRIPVARREAKLPAPCLQVLGRYEEILGREAVLAAEALDALAAQ